MSQKRIKFLEGEIRKHNDLYWNKNAPIISDTDYDLLTRELLILDPTNTVPFEFAEDVNVGNKIKHKHPMISMDKQYSIEDIKKWAKKMKGDWFTVSPKMDGSALALHYEDGILILALTRGKDGLGQDVTLAAKRISNIPKVIKCKDTIEVRGEAFVKLSDFAKIQYGPKHKKFENARNASSGVLKRETEEGKAKVKMTFHAYNVIGSGEKTEFEKFSFLRDQGFRHVLTYSVNSADKLICFLRRIETDQEPIWDKDKWDFEADGLIIMAGDVDEQETLGCTRHHPRYAMALKFQGESGFTIIRSIEWSVGKTGAITPVAIVDPIHLSGATITRISLHNVSQMKSKGFTVGAQIEVSRRGGVIPQAERVVKDNGGKTFEPPRRCPSCNSATVIAITQKKKESVEFLNCTGSFCKAQTAGKIEYFAKVMGIDGLGEKIVEQLCEHGVRTPVDLYRLSATKMVCNVDRLGEKSAKNILKNIEDHKTVPLHTFMRALGIHQLGNHVSEELGKYYTKVEDVLAMTADDFRKLAKVDKLADKFVKDLKQAAPMIRRLLDFVTVSDQIPQKPIGAFTGLSFVFTGKMTIMKRKAAQQAVKDLGGDAPSSVKTDLTYLVVGGDESSSKQDKAEKYNQSGSVIEIITEKKFVEMIGN